MSAITLRNVAKKFDNFTAIKGLDLEIEDGEFFTMLGPSGSGKTTHCSRFCSCYQSRRSSGR